MLKTESVATTMLWHHPTLISFASSGTTNATDMRLAAAADTHFGSHVRTLTTT